MVYYMPSMLTTHYENAQLSILCWAMPFLVFAFGFGFGTWH